MLVGEFQGARKFQEFRDHVGQRARLPQDQIAVLVQIGAGLRFAADHLRVAGNRRQGVFEFVRDAGGKLAERGQIFLHVNLFLQRGEFGQVAQQANRAGDFVGVVLDRGNGHAELAQFVRRREVFDFLAAKRAAVFQASGDEFREARSGAEDFAGAAIGEGFHAEGGFGGGIRAGNQAGGIDEQQAGGHVARDRFAHALGLLRALAFGAVQGFEFFFLFF